MRLKTITNTLSTLVFFAVLAIAGTASAQVASTTPVCTPSVQGFTPHIYGGTLQSFDYFYTATGTPVVIDTTVGGNKIEPRYSSLWSQTGSTKIHVDVPGWYGISGTVPIAVTVATPTGCVETYTFSLQLPGTNPANPEMYPKGSTATQGAHTYTTKTPYVAGKGGQGIVTTPIVPPTGTTATLRAECTPESVHLNWKPQAGAQSYVVEKKAHDGVFAAIKILPKRELAFSDTDVEGAAVYTYRIRGFDGVRFVGVSDEATCGVPVDSAGGTIVPQGTTGESCSSWVPALWTALIILQLILSLITIDMLHKLLVGNGWRLSAALFVPFAVLLALWFVFDGCRLYQWFPIAVTLITLFTLFAPIVFKKTVPVAK